MNCNILNLYTKIILRYKDNFDTTKDLIDEIQDILQEREDNKEITDDELLVLGFLNNLIKFDKRFGLE